MKQGLIILITLFIFNSSTAQRKVESKAYDKTLKVLLSHSVNEVSVEDVLQMNQPVFLDSRAKREYEVSHIQGAKWIGYDEFDIKSVEGFPKDTTIVVYCSVGYRSEKISEQLIKDGFTNVSNLYGGIFEWSNAEQPVFNNENESTKEVHAYDRVWGFWLKKGKKVYK